jgi:MYXO-CTERM domain-containing protein
VNAWLGKAPKPEWREPHRAGLPRHSGYSRTLLIEIDPVTGRATFIATTALTIGAVIDVNGTAYTFNNVAGQVATLDLANGNTTAISNFPSDGGLLVEGASPTPEPASFFLAAIAMGGILVLRRRHCQSATNL